FGMVMTLLILTRSVMHLHDYITDRHLDKMAKVMLLTGSIVGFSYATEFFSAWYSGNPYEQATIFGRAIGSFAWAFWTMVFCNVVVPQFLWSRRVRACVPVLFVISILVNVGMWFERFVIIVTSLYRSYLPATWVTYRPTGIEVGTLIGSFGLFFTCFLLFIRLLPMIAMWEVKADAGAETHAAIAG